MNWYIAKIIFHITTSGSNHTPQFDEQLRLIEAPDEQEAFKKARWKGQQEEDSFLNNAQETVKWQFVDIAELTALQKIEDGMELYSKIRETSDASNYINIVKQKAHAIEMKSHVELLNSWL